MIEACSNCKFFQVSEWFSKCRRYPEPVNHKPTDWCGEYVKVAVPETKQPEEQPVKQRGRPKKNV